MRLFKNKILRKIFVSKETSAKPYEDTNIQDNNVFIGERTVVIDTVFGKNNKIGNDCFFYKVRYGNYTYNSQRVTIMNCTIGKFCSIAQGASIGLGKHPVNNFVSTHPAFYSVHKQCGKTFADQQYFDEMGHVEIGNDVWIGANSIILDDVTIGNGAIIAANSVVTKDVPAYAIVGGTPAKVLKYRFIEADIDFLENLKWWDKDLEWLQKNFKIMQDLNLLKSEAL